MAEFKVEEVPTEVLALLSGKRLDWLLSLLKHETWADVEQVAVVLLAGKEAIQEELQFRQRAQEEEAGAPDGSSVPEAARPLGKEIEGPAVVWPDFSKALGSVMDIGVDMAPEAPAVKEPQQEATEPQPEATELVVEAGKRYYRRRGKLTGVLTTDTTLRGYKFFDPLTGINYFENGRAFDGGRTDAHDLVREYVEPGEQEKTNESDPVVVRERVEPF